MCYAEGERARGLTYKAVPNGFRIVNGQSLLNRPLYGTHARDTESLSQHCLYVAGDRPVLTIVLVDRQEHRGSDDARLGTLVVGAAVGGMGKWCHEFDRIEATYDPGLMCYTLIDKLLQGGTMRLRFVPLAEEQGFAAEIVLRGVPTNTRLIWAYGGMTGYDASLKSHRPSGHPPMEVDCTGDRPKVEGERFTLLGGETEPELSFSGGCTFAGTYRVRDAKAFKDGPLALWHTKVSEAPLLVHLTNVQKALTGYIAVARGEPSSEALDRAFDEGETRFDECVQHAKESAHSVVIKTPDPYLDKAMEAAQVAMHGAWHDPVFTHGAWGWHDPYLGWRMLYGPTVLGWHERVESCLHAHASNQIQEPPTAEPSWSGRRPYASGGDSRGGVPSLLTSRHVFYNMTEVFLDHIIYYWDWTGDLEFARALFPVLEKALEWERRTFDPDDDGLYENWLNTWVSDAHWYNGGGCIQSSAYNYRANLKTAEIARRLGENPAEFEERAEKIKAACNGTLWVPAKGVYAEYKDAIGLKRLHESPELASIYHPIDFYLANEFQAYQMLRFTEYGLRNEYATPRGGRLIWNSEWLPPLYSSLGLYPQECINTWLCYCRLGLTNKADELMRGIVDGFWMGPHPGGTSHRCEWDGTQNGSVDFADTVSIFLRTVVEGLFGIQPQMADETVIIAPAFPPAWRHASIQSLTVAYDYSYVPAESEAPTETISVRTAEPTAKVLRLIAKYSQVRSLRVNGAPTDFRVEPGVGHAWIVAKAPKALEAEFVVTYSPTPCPQIKHAAVAATGEPFEVRSIGGELVEVFDPQGVLRTYALQHDLVRGPCRADCGYHTFFILTRRGKTSAWLPVDVEVRAPLEVVETQLLREKKGMVYSLRLRSNLSHSVALHVEAHMPGARGRTRVRLMPYATSHSIRFEVTNAQELTPGSNWVTLEVSGDRREILHADACAWDLLEVMPSLTQSLRNRVEFVNLENVANDALAELDKHQYLSPRPKTYSIMTRANGRSVWDWNAWGYNKGHIDDSGLRTPKPTSGICTTAVGVPFKQVLGPKNGVVVALWDNFPNEVTIPIDAQGSKLYLLLCGVTNPMQSRIANSLITVEYEDKSTSELELVNPDNFDDLMYAPYHLTGATESLGENTHGIVLDLPLEVGKNVKCIHLKALSNEVITTLLGVTIVP